MIISGQYTTAEIFTDNIEDAALQWVREQCDHPAFEGVRILQMPDVHAGNACNVGTVYRIGAYVNPDHVGVDIGCTISMHRLSAAMNPDDFALLDHRIRETVPTGTEICEKNSINEKDLFRFLNSRYQKARSAAPDLINEAPRIDARFISDFCRRIKLQEGIFYKSIGTLGGGNHFIEYGEEESGEGWLTIHCGSRNLGVKVANHWHNIANNPKRAQYIGYLWGDALKGYLSDMIIAQAYAIFNHDTIRDRIFAILKKLCKAKCTESIYTTHNYISVTDEYPMLRKGAIEASEGRKVCIPFNMRDGIAICMGKGNEQWLDSAPHGAGRKTTHNYISVTDEYPMLRKGAIEASEGRKVCIPFNMRDGIAICMGKGNEQWLDSAPHGAGRKVSRNQARKLIPLSEYEASMSGIFSTSICAETLDESPQAYKPSEEILSLITPTVDVISFVRPKFNIKDTGK